MSKTCSLTEQIWSWIQINSRLMNSTMISYVNSFLGIQPWIYNILLNSHEFIYNNTNSYSFHNMNSYEFIYMNSAAWILRWIHIYIYIYINSDVWFHDIFHDHEFRSELISWIHIRFCDHEFICYIAWPMNSDMNSCIWKISGNQWHIWN